MADAIGAQAIIDLGAGELAQRVRAGTLSASEVVDAFIAQIEHVDGDLNAVVVRRFEEARAEAAAADAARLAGRSLGPLHGVPITIKEQFLLEGTPTTFGLEWRRGHRADHTGPLVTALRAAGAIVLGKTNVGQTLLYHEADNPLYGCTRNPWDLERTPGGSSGGEAAIVAAHGSPLGLGGDLGGSIRVPAHFSGISGLKPTTGRLSLADTPDDIAAPPTQLPPSVGPLARDVVDLHLAMGVLAAAGVASGDTPPDAFPYPSDLPDVRGLRVAVQIDDSFFRSAPAIRRAVREAMMHLQAAGATSVDFRPPSLADAPRLFLGVMASDGGAWVQAALRDDRPDPRVMGLLKAGKIPEAARPLVAAAMRLGGQRHLAFTVAAARRSQGARMERLTSELAAYRAAYQAAMDATGADIVLSPPHALPALRHGASELLSVGNAAAYAVLYNVLGLPAGVVPVTNVREDEESDRPKSRDSAERAAAETERGSAGLPIGVQVAARAWREDIVLSAMTVIERGVKAGGGMMRKQA